MLVNADGHVTDHIFVHAGLAFQFGDGIARSVKVEHYEMRLAVLLDLVGKAAKAPGFGLYDFALILFDDLGGIFSQRIYLCL